jgi:competence protein ComEC
MPSYVFHCLKRAPFLRIVLFLSAGILLQWHCQFTKVSWYLVSSATFISQICFSQMNLFKRFRYGFLDGIVYLFHFISLGALLTIAKDTRNATHWFGNYEITNVDALIVSIDEPLSEKPKSFKAVATIQHVVNNNSVERVKGKLIVYFSKDSLITKKVSYGSVLIINKYPQDIRSQGNPGAFDFKKYALFQGITHQVYLQQNNFRILDRTSCSWIRHHIFNLRNWVLQTLRSYIKGRTELGLAEALLIGYKDDLDKNLIQSYSNTGVVHVIAISGLHLGLIYLLLGLLCKPLSRRKKFSWLSPILVIAGLWCFTLLAGAQPSVLRSAVMFTCIVVGEKLNRRSSIYNTLAFSAFLLLCYNPFWLWDVGFQLSYSAVLSIVIFMRPVYNIFYFKNRIVDFFWKLNAVTLAAQILTTPLSMYHFSQFPNYFFLTNFIAVPLSSLILLGEILLCAISFIAEIASFLGDLLEWLIGIMNQCVQNVESMPFSIWSGLQINFAQLLFLYLFIAVFTFTLLEKTWQGLKWALLSFVTFMILRTFSFANAGQQQTLIIYNIPQKTAMDFIIGRHVFYFGDSTVLKDQHHFNNYLKPCRIKYRVDQGIAPATPRFSAGYISFANFRIIVGNEHRKYRSSTGEKIRIDLLFMPRNSKASIQDLANFFSIQRVVLDGSAPAWKIKSWKSICDSLGISNHDISTKGAFVMTLR